MNRDHCCGMDAPHSSQVALLIDGENGPASMIEAILSRASEWGEVVLRRVYGDWSSPRMRPWKEAITRYGMRAVTCHQPKKNAVDIALAVDAMDLFYQGFHRFCLVSGDSDYVPLVLWLVEHGCLVAIIGQKQVSLSLQHACSVFVSSEQLCPDTMPGQFSAQETRDAMQMEQSVPASQARTRQRGKKKRFRSSSSTIAADGKDKL